MLTHSQPHDADERTRRCGYATSSQAIKFAHDPS
jgi:hypothetical protein